MSLKAADAVVSRGTSQHRYDGARWTRLQGLDGLRAIAVVGVLLYHAGVRSVPGGFLGVDLFFVISGFLITSILVDEARRHGRVSFGRFYERRARRLLPALAAMVAVATASMARFHPADLAQARGDIAAAAGYVSNWWYVLHHRSYFAAAGRPEPFQHLWSLAVEEQFYLIWPLVLAVMLAARARLGVIACVAVAGAVASTWWMRALAINGNVPFDTDSSRLYFGTDTHASALLLGAAAAAVMAGLANRRARTERRQPGAFRAIGDVAGCCAVGALVLSMHRVGYYTTPGLYRGGFLAVAAMAVVAVVAASAPGGWLGRALDVVPLRFVGQRSYGLYLWHWPVFVYTRPALDWPLHGWAALAARLAITAVLAELSFRLVELPLRGRVARGDLPSRARLTAWRLAAGLAGGWRVAAPVVGSGAGIVGVIAVTTFVVSHASHAALAARPAAGAAAGTDAAVDATSRLPDSGTRHAPSSMPAVGDTTPPDATSASATPSAASTSATVRSLTPTLTPSRLPSVSPARPDASKPAAALPAQVLPPTQDATTPPPIPRTAPPLLTAVGDSVIVDAEHALQHDCHGTEVYGVVGWPAKSVFAEIAALRAAGHLGSLVVIETGTNGVVSPAELNATLAALADRQHVVVVNNHMDRPWEPANNAMFPGVVRAHPNAVLVDWDTAANSHPDWLSTDGIHLRPAGVGPYAALIRTAAQCS